MPDSTHPAVDGVGSCQNTAAGVEAGVDAGLGDGDSALLHHLVNGRAVHVRHLVKLIDADHTSVSQDHGPRLQTALTWEVGREKHTTIQVVGDGGRCQSTSKHPAPSHKWENAVKRCQLLRLGADPGVIYLSSDLDSITCPTLIPKQPASNGLPSQISSLSLTFFKPFPN